MTSPIALYHCDEGSGTTAADSSGNGRNATLTSASWGLDHTGGPGASLLFSGAEHTSYGTIPNDTGLSALGTNGGSFSLCAWVRMTGADVAILSKPGTTAWAFFVNSGTTTAVLSVNSVSASWTNFVGTVVIGDTAWHHICAVYDQGDGTVRIYVDGVIDSSFSAAGDVVETTDAIRIGDWDYTQNGCGLDEIQIFSVALTDSDVASLAGGGTGGGSDLICQLPNTNVFQSPYNWIAASDSITACTPGPYLKGVVSGTAKIVASLDTTLNAGMVADDMPALRIFVVDQTATDAYGRSGVASVWNNVGIASNNSPEQVVSLATGLNPAHTYEYAIFVVGSHGTGDNSWTGTQNWCRLNSLQFDGTATLSAYAPKTKNAMILGDSILQAYYGDSPDQASYNYIDPSTSWAVWVSEALGCEFMCRGVGSQGWLLGGANFGFPAFPASWNMLTSAVSCNLTTPAAPDYIFAEMGTNDHGQNSAAVQSAVTEWIAAVRSTAGCAESWIFCVIPIDRMQASAITAGVAAASDPKAVVVDLGSDEFTTGETFSAPTFVCPDGIHPSRTYHGLLAAIITQRVQSAIQAAETPTITTTITTCEEAGMSIYRNRAGQGVYLNAKTSAGAPDTGDAANITATISIDGGTPVATATANPTEIGGGVYYLPLARAETNAMHGLAIIPVSATSGVTIQPVIPQIQPIAYCASGGV